jgi:hypothetical protein
MTARPITDTGQRRKVLSRIASPNELDAWIRQAFTALVPRVAVERCHPAFQAPRAR